MPNDSLKSILVEGNHTKKKKEKRLLFHWYIKILIYFLKMN